MSGLTRIARTILRRPARLIRRQLLPKLIPPATGVRVAPQGPVRIVGLLSSGSGLGKSARLCVGVLTTKRYDVSTADASSIFASGDNLEYPASSRTVFSPGGLSIYHLNPPMLLPALLRSGLSRYYHSYNIGYWAWELESLPREWIEALRFMQAIIVPSKFCQTAVQRYTSKPVLVVAHPVQAVPDREVPSPADDSHRPLRILNIFRFGSSFERKNPIALVRAFRTAFWGNTDVLLVLKTSYGDRYVEEKAALMREISGVANVLMIDAVWDDARVAALIRSSDVYASLHRSEGFGLPLAEAMMSQVPVVATNWSGNTDFCSPKHTFPVDYTLIPVRDNHPDYDEMSGARWADPSVEHAAAQLRRVFSDLAAARAKAKEAKRGLIEHLRIFDYGSALRELGGALRESPKTTSRDRSAQLRQALGE